jgi:ribosomal protein L32
VAAAGQQGGQVEGAVFGSSPSSLASPFVVGNNNTTKEFTRSFAVPKRKTSRHRRGMRFNHPSKRIRSKKVYSYCETCDEVLGPHQICTGVLAGTCTSHLFQNRGGDGNAKAEIDRSIDRKKDRNRKLIETDRKQIETDRENHVANATTLEAS